ncbi:DNA methyltransferase C1 [Lysinibacillus sp. PLM2]|nr:DNA methyltransferase C1 [Lysinibacillus sp. PLM2]
MINSDINNFIEINDDNSLVKKVNEIDWEFSEADTQYLTHNIHRYSGKFIPQIARKAIELITNPHDIILDPYCGSGTTLLEAALTNRKSIGVDLNPLAVLISETKTTVIDSDTLDQYVRNVQEFIEKLIEHSKEDSIFQYDEIERLYHEVETDWRYNDEWFNKWFQKQVLTELIIIHKFINSIEEVRIFNLALTAFSDILRKVSNAHSGYPNVMLDKNAKVKQLPSPIFLKAFLESTSMVRELSRENLEYKPSIVQTDNTKLPIENESIDAIITHPPYIGSIPYAEYGTLSLGWLGHDSKVLDKQLTGGQRQSKYVVERFEEGYKGMLQESFRVLKKNKKMFIMVGNPVVKGEKIDLGLMTKKLCHEVGFKLIVETTRNGINRRANKMGEEFLLFFEKE